MILVTVGTQLPFDRLITAMDHLAPSLPMPVFAQIGRSEYTPVNMEWAREMAPPDFFGKLRAASVIVAHAGIGTVLAAQRLAKPIVLVPRRAALGEHRNDHQLATCEQLQHRPGIYVSHDVSELREILSRTNLGPPSPLEDNANRDKLVTNLRAALEKWA